MSSTINQFRLPYPILAVSVGTFISRFGTGIVLPYIALLLVHLKHLPIYVAGIAIGASYLAQAFGTSLTGNLLNRMNLFELIKPALIIYASLFISMGLILEWIVNPWWVGFGFIFCFLLAGGCCSLIESIGQIIISELASPDQKHFAFSLRYVFINIGMSLGSLFAIYIGVSKVNLGFYAAAISIFLYYLLLQLTVKTPNFKFKLYSKSNLSTNFRFLAIDRKLRYFTFAAILCYVGYCQFQTLFAYIVYHYFGSVHVFAMMSIINGMAIVFLQIPLIQSVKKLNINLVISGGILLLAAGLIGVAISKTFYLGYYLSSFIFSLGEIFTLSMIGMYIDHLATPETRYIYFSISNMAIVGRIVGPGLATMLCAGVGLTSSLLIVALITLLGVPCMLFANAKPIANVPDLEVQRN